jgi:hypothetical protein
MIATLKALQYISGWGFTDLAIGFPRAPLEYAGTQINPASVLSYESKEEVATSRNISPFLLRRRGILSIFAENDRAEMKMQKNGN